VSRFHQSVSWHDEVPEEITSAQDQVALWDEVVCTGPGPKSRSTTKFIVSTEPDIYTECLNILVQALKKQEGCLDFTQPKCSSLEPEPSAQFFLIYPMASQPNFFSFYFLCVFRFCFFLPTPTLYFAPDEPFVASLPRMSQIL
jgi:hypothetical protein